MKSKMLGLGLLFLAIVPLGDPPYAYPGKESGDISKLRESWRVLDPITRRNLTIYPVVSSLHADVAEFLTLDEGLAAGVVRIAERGQIESAMYRRRGPRRPEPMDERLPEMAGASVNELMLVNQSSRPLILLAGEVVSGGKQTRIVGADLVVPPKSEPLPLTVFCVEHGRWSETKAGFGAAYLMAAPAMRLEAQAKKSQAGVWQSVDAAGGALQANSPTSSYQEMVTSPQAKRALDEAASSIESQYERDLRQQLRGRDVVGVVVAINGDPVWSDVFSSPELFEKYWPKLLRSYVVEAESRGRGSNRTPDFKEAQAFLLENRGRVSIRTEPEAYRRTEISTRDYQIVALEALDKGTDDGLLIHYNKMTLE